MTRRRRTTLQRAAIFEAHGGICHLCGAKINGTREAWDLEHVVPYALTRDDSDENLRPAHASCHKAKTAQDVGQIAKAARVSAKHKGARKPGSMPGSKASPWKRRVDGTTVRRDET